MDGPRLYRLGCVLLWGIVGMMSGPVASYGQGLVSPSSLEVPSPEATITTAVDLLNEKQTEAALPLLEHLVARNPAYVSSSMGAGAYWLGEVHARMGRSEKARRAWAHGVDTLDRAPVRLIDAYLRSLRPAVLSNHLPQAPQAYLDLLGRVRPEAPDAEQTVFRRYVAQMAPLMDDEALAHVIHESREVDPSTWTFREGSGVALQSWWRRRDVYPATAPNERLSEHLSRLAYAQKAYACSSRVSGLDDRGHVYLRFGDPSKRHSIAYHDGDFFKEVFRFGVAVSPADFPKNELWTYPHIDESGYYLFAKPRRCFVMAQANDLLPKHLRQRRGRSERGLNIAYSSLMAMRYIYHNLAMYHPDFSLRFNEIAKYADWQTTRASIAEAREATGGKSSEGRTVGGGMGQKRRVYADPQFGIDPPNEFVSQMVRRARREDRAAAKRREKVMPRQYTGLSDRVESLPIAVRTARFLTPSGSTRTSVYWGVRTASLQEETDASHGAVVHMTGVRYDEAYKRQEEVVRQYIFRNETVRDEQALLPPAVSIPGTADPYHVAMQWLQFDAHAPKSGAVDMGAFRREATIRTDSVRPLRADGRRLEMSDIQVRVLDRPDAPPASWEETSKPYPFRTIASSTPLLLHFELYHLTFGADDRTHYTIAYEVETKTRQGWARVARDRHTEQVSTSATYSGSSRRTDEYIALDLSALRLEQQQAVRVTVRVVDETTEASVERGVRFTVDGDRRRNRN